MSKKYIKMNNNDNYLSLGNFMRIIKEISKNKSSALQTEIFCILFKIDSINDTTVNNYCVGIRSIGDTYKQTYLNLSNRYSKDHEAFKDILLNLANIMDGKIHFEEDISFLNHNESLKTLSFKMYNIAKNDENVDKDFVSFISDLLKQEDYYSFLVEILIHIVLRNRQPLYELDIKKGKIEELLNDSYISYKGIEDYLKLKLQESINYEYTMKKLAKEGNVLANFEIGSNEYLGHVMGYPRYNIAYEYLIVAHNANHAGASFLIGDMYLNGFIGSKSNDDLKKAYDFFMIASKNGNVASLNKLGLMYLNGIYPVKQSKKKALEYFKLASEHNYVYAFNNIGHIHEMEGKKDCIDYYMKSANLHECWSCNKIGEYYRLQGNMVEAYKYYTDALQGNARNRCFFAYYNLAKYYYFNGCSELGIEKDLVRYLEYMDIASKNNLIEASMELLLYYLDLYKKNRHEEDLKKVKEYQHEIECNPKFNLEYKKYIEDEISKIYKIDNLEIV